MITLQSCPNPIEQLASEIADRIFTAQWDNAERANLARLLMQFAAEIKRTSWEG
jgi:hypothetical protein